MPEQTPVINLKDQDPAVRKMLEQKLRAKEQQLLMQNSETSRIANELEKIHMALAKIEFPEIEYLDYIKKNYHEKGIGSYLEVGVRWGDSLAMAKPDCMAVGVDPNFDLKHDLPSLPKLFSMTSDDFFFQCTDEYASSFELVFLDGLHEARQTAKDIWHSLDVLKPGGEILVHDVLPISMTVANPESKSHFWTGNVWQSAYAYCGKNYPLKWEFIDAFPSGLLRLYDIDPEFRPPRADIAKSVRHASQMQFEARELLDFLRSL